MQSIELMVQEHRNIKRVLASIRKLCFKTLKGEYVDYNIFYKIIDFVRNYADKHHHSKEENILFKKISEELPMAHAPVTAMLTEHFQGRYYIQNLDNAIQKVKDGDEESKLDIIANSIAYANLLNLHIDKEDNVLYKLGERQLSSSSKQEIDRACAEIEELANKDEIQTKYIKLIDEIENSI